MLTGHVPFEGESIGEVLMKHLTAEPDLTALAEPYRGIVERALAKDPALRLKSVGELVALLPGGDTMPNAPRGQQRTEQVNEPDTANGGWPLYRGPGLKFADAAAMAGLKEVVGRKSRATISQPPKKSKNLFGKRFAKRFPATASTRRTP